MEHLLQKYKSTRVNLLILLVIFLIPTITHAQVRPDIYSFTSAERTELGNLIIDYVDEVQINVKEFELTSLSPNPATNIVNVAYKAENANSAYLIVQMPYGGAYNYIIDVNQNQTTINLNNYQTGVYSVVLVCNG